MSLDVYFNGAALLGPKTGIGQYCLQMMTAMQQIPGIRPHYFYRGEWSESLRTGQGEQQSRVLKSKISFAENHPRLANVAFQVRQWQNSLRFAAGVKSNSRAVYHEPNFLSFYSKLPTVLTVHDLSVLRYPETHPEYRVLLFNRRLADSIRRADVVVTDSEFVRQEVLAEYGLPAEKVVAIKLGAPHSFKPVSADTMGRDLAAFGLNPGRYILAVGTLEPRKNLTTAIKAYSGLPESLRQALPFAIVGMKGWRMEGFDDRIAALVESGQIRRLGYVADDILPSLYSGARLFVYPSLYEGFGLPPLEAMACGAPVIVSDRSSLPEVVGDAGVKVSALDTEELMEAMRSIAEDDDKAAAMRQAGLTQAARFSWRRCAEQTADVYRRLAS